MRKKSAFDDVARADGRCKIVIWKALQHCRSPFQYHVRIQIFVLYRDLSLTDAWCCRASPSINTSQSAIQHDALIAKNHGKEKLFLN